MKLKDKIARLLIPKSTIYCHHEFKKHKKYGMCAEPCIFFRQKNKKVNGHYVPVQYCSYLKKPLDIQDQVKDCGINE